MGLGVRDGSCSPIARTACAPPSSISVLIDTSEMLLQLCFLPLKSLKLSLLSLLWANSPISQSSVTCDSIYGSVVHTRVKSMKTNLRRGFTKRNQKLLPQPLSKV